MAGGGWSKMFCQKICDFQRAWLERSGDVRVGMSKRSECRWREWEGRCQGS